jgi:tetratricopeptide (TPR) repeat protein
MMTSLDDGSLATRSARILLIKAGLTQDEADALLNYVKEEFVKGSIRDAEDIKRHIQTLLVETQETKIAIKRTPGRAESIFWAIVANILYDWIKSKFDAFVQNTSPNLADEEVVQVEWDGGWHLEPISIDKSSRKLFSNHLPTGGRLNSKACVFYDAIGMIDDLSKAHKRAEVARRRAVITSRRVHGRNHESTAAALSNLALCLSAQNRLPDAARHYAESLKILRNTIGLSPKFPPFRSRVSSPSDAHDWA